MTNRIFYAVVVNGKETNKRVRYTDAVKLANELRAKHGTYAVWLRQHLELIPSL
jgi:hypothetical protein